MNYFNYFTEIEEAFIRRRGRHLLLSPIDWALIESWKERGVPLKIALRGVNNVFDSIEQNADRSVNVKSLTYCRNEVDSLFEAWQATQVGKSKDETPEQQTSDARSVDQPNLYGEDEFAQSMTRLAKSLTEASEGTSGRLANSLSDVADRVQKLSSFEGNEEELETRLTELEAMVSSALIEATDDVALKNRRNEIEQGLKKHKEVTAPEAYEQTVDLMLRKSLREEWRIPKLSLYDL